MTVEEATSSILTLLLPPLLQTGSDVYGRTYVKPVDRFMPARMVETEERKSVDIPQLITCRDNILRTASKA
jgi:hypothetical protein